MPNENDGTSRAWRIFESVAAAVILAALAKFWTYDPMIAIFTGLAVMSFGYYYIKAREDGDSTESIVRWILGAVAGGLLLALVLGWIFG
ncbi:hypothetical protein ACIBTP_24960 [Streptomyces avidinii]|uniref:hypothetical protein n=1 Tax=Streptomyces avidinii TaxID=1895 RepID=UPI00378B3670